jgi:ABC-type transporter Mla subunit MlaD
MGKISLYFNSGLAYNYIMMKTTKTTLEKKRQELKNTLEHVARLREEIRDELKTLRHYVKLDKNNARIMRKILRARKNIIDQLDGAI